MLKYFKNFIYNWIFNERWGRGSFLSGGESNNLPSFFLSFFFLDMFFVSQHLCSISRQHEANFVLLSAICNKVYLKFSLSVLLRANLTTFHQNLLKDLYLSPWPSLKWKVIIRANWFVFYIPIITVLHILHITPFSSPFSHAPIRQHNPICYLARQWNADAK